MAIEIKCKCGSDYRLDDNRAGEHFSCKVCGMTMLLPAGVGRAIPGTSVTSAKKAAVAATKKASRGRDSSMDHVGTNLESSASAARPVPRHVAPSAEETPPIGWASKPHLLDDEDTDQPESRTPPVAWCAGRLVMWGLCAGFMFMPWFSRSGEDAQTGMKTAESINGFQIVKVVCQSAGKPAEIRSNVSMGPLSEFTNVPDGAGRVVAGGIVMLFSPCLYAVGLLLVIIIAPLAYSREGKGALLPFLTCLISLAGFIIGWHLIAGAEPFKPILDVASQVGVSIGVSGWAYTMSFVLIVFCLIARAKPDFNLVQALRWSEKRSNSGPL